MKKGLRKTISIIAISTMMFQIAVPMMPGIGTNVLAVENLTSKAEIQTEQMAGDMQEQEEIKIAELVENTNNEETTGEISRDYEIKDEET